jgi:hypothetical protein
MSDDALELLVISLIRRKRATREGSAMHAFLIRQLQGIAARYEHGAGLIGYYDHDASAYGIY